MDFPIADLMDEQACYRRLLQALHPDGLCCPHCGRDDGFGVHRRHRDPILDYRCRACRCVFNAFTGTLLQKTHRSCREWVLILRGVSQGVSTARLARELGCSRGHLLDLRHKLQANAELARDRSPLPDRVVEADEMYQNAGEKRLKTRGSGRSATAPRQQRQRARHLGKRPPAGAGRARCRQQRASIGSDATQ